MNIFKTSDGGRDLMVKVPCCRCNKTELMTWAQAMPESKEGYIRDSRLPGGWEHWAGLLLFCPDCRKAFAEFLHPTVKKEDEQRKHLTRSRMGWIIRFMSIITLAILSRA